MSPSYFILLAATIVLPTIAIVLNRNFKPKKIFKYLKIPIVFFSVFLVSEVNGYSLMGDYPNYICNALAYFVFVLSILSFPKMFKNPLHTNIIRRTLFVPVGVIFGIGCFGIFFFLLISEDFDSKETYNIISDSNEYITRKYSSGSATQYHIKYTFETFKTYKYMPIEKRVDNTTFLSEQSKLILNNKDSLQISIKNNLITFNSSNGALFQKQLD